MQGKRRISFPLFPCRTADAHTLLQPLPSLTLTQAACVLCRSPLFLVLPPSWRQGSLPLHVQVWLFPGMQVVFLSFLFLSSLFLVVVLLLLLLLLQPHRPLPLLLLLLHLEQESTSAATASSHSSSWEREPRSRGSRPPDAACYGITRRARDDGEREAKARSPSLSSGEAGEERLPPPSLQEEHLMHAYHAEKGKRVSLSLLLFLLLLSSFHFIREA